MFYFKFFEVNISCRRKYCLYHAVSIKLPPSQPPLFIKDLIQKLLSYSLLSYTVTAWEMLQVVQDLTNYLGGGIVMNKEDVVQDMRSSKI